MSTLTVVKDRYIFYAVKFRKTKLDIFLCLLFTRRHYFDRKKKKLLYAVGNGEGITAAATATIPPTKTSRSVGSNSEAGIFSSISFCYFVVRSILLLASGHLFCFRGPGSPPSHSKVKTFFIKRWKSV